MVWVGVTATDCPDRATKLARHISDPTHARRTRMDLNKLSTADRVIGASAIVFLISTFLPWWGKDFGAEFGVSVGTYTQNGWDYFLTGLIPPLPGVGTGGGVVLGRFPTAPPGGG